MRERYLRLEEVLLRVPYSRTEWYRGMKEGTFPRSYQRRPDKAHARGVCWKESEVNELMLWIESSGTTTPSFCRHENRPDSTTNRENASQAITLTRAK